MNSGAEQMIGRKFGHYVVTGKLGAGGMGEVYRARDEQLDRDVALKLLPAGVVGDEAARKQFRKEALALAKLNHPNIETIYEFGNQDGVDYLAMELVPGRALDEILAAGPMPESEIVRLGSQFADGLAAAHDQGIIHRDLKPGNLFVTPDGRVKILDFGLAKLLHPQLTGDVTRSVTVQSGSISGTVPYMSPEQLRGLPVDARSDIYGAGAVLYEMASGRRPFPQTQTAELMGAILMQALPPVRDANPNVTPRMERVITKALEKEPSQRYQTARELKAALQSAGMSATVVLQPEAEAAKTRVLPENGAAQPAASGGAQQIPTPTPVMTPGSAAGWAAQAPAALGGTSKGASGAGQAAAGAMAGPGAGSSVAAGTASGTKASAAIAEGKPGSQWKLIGGIAAIFLAGVALFAIGIFGARDWILKQLKPGEEAAKSAAARVVPGKSAAPARNASASHSQPEGAEGGAPKAAPPKPAMPSNADAARYYSEALGKLRVEDETGARELLEKSIAAEADFALSHAALAGAWSAMGYDAKARAEGEQGYKLAAGLADAERMEAEAQYRETTHEWSKAAEMYAGLQQASPANVEYGLGLTAMQIRMGKPKEAQATIAALKKLPAAGGDPRLDETSAAAAEALGQYKAEQGAAASAVARARAMKADSMVAGALLRESWAQAMLGQAKEAIAEADESQRIFAAAGDSSRAAAALRVAATLFAREGNLDGAKSKFEQALAAAKQAGDDARAGEDLTGLAGVLERAGDFGGARKPAQDALASCQAAGDRDCESFAREMLGEIAFGSGDLAGAEARYEESLAIAKEDEDSAAELADLLGLSELHYEQGDLDGARKRMEEAGQAWQGSGDAYWAAVSQARAGGILEAEGNLEDARKSFEGAMNGFTDLGAKRNATEEQVEFAGVIVEQGRPSGIEAPLRRAIAEFQAEKNGGDEALARAALARALLALGTPENFVAAQKEVNAAIPVLRGVQDPRPRLEVIVVAARAAAALGEAAQAEKTLEGTLAEAEKHQFAPIEFEIRLALGQIEMKSGKADAGRARLEALSKDATDKGFLLVAQKAQAAEK
jgi:tetratricopeptide (TPR) repeat protein